MVLESESEPLGLQLVQWVHLWVPESADTGDQCAGCHIQQHTRIQARSHMPSLMDHHLAHSIPLHLCRNRGCHHCMGGGLEKELGHPKAQH